MTNLFADHFAIQRELGRGSFGVVHLALDTRLGNRPVALKVLHPALNADPQTLALFENEAGLLAGLDHDHIVTVYDAGVWQNQRYIVMRYVDGPTLAEVVRDEGAQEPERVAAWLRQAADALAYAHGQKMIHRDLKAANLLWDRGRDRLYLSDFGLAKAVELSGGSSSGGSKDAMTGTAAYRAPEVRNTGHTVASDLYSLGVIGYELLAGRRPFTDTDPLDLLLAHATDPVPPLPEGTPMWLGEVVMRLLEKDAGARYATGADVVAALSERRAPAKATSAARAPTPSVASTKPVWEQIGVKLVRIPAGDFLYGDAKERVYLDEFWIAETPVTNRQYKAFVDATGHRAPDHWQNGAVPEGKEEHPVVRVSWYDAQDFCQWAGCQLPDERQWEKAARGTDGREYPWGDEEPTPQHCNFGENVGNTTPVRRYPAYANGLYDMAGNVWEWCQDLYDDAHDWRVVRGGSFGNSRRLVRGACRVNWSPNYRLRNLGFRVVCPPGP
ncbi:MAG: SUMF1/EgtB/PvdO family nonheme iron enzyme [Caldilineaceae bacterium]|nr:SUMF1/EgtB/PvdO family nonheme iron enzyme [Caldilineaceae bacterium]